jgi:hypothetical protein
MGQTIGFTNIYYTLWHVSAPYKEYVSQYNFYWRVDKQFIQNLSQDLDKAKAKLTGDFEIDLELRGTSFQSARVGRVVDESPEWNYDGYDLRNTDFTKILFRVYLSQRQSDQRRLLKQAVYARRRLIELGELIRYTYWVEQLDQDDQFIKVRFNYATERQVEIEEQKKDTAENSGHFFSDGERVILSLSKVGSFSFDTMYGTTYIVTYKDSEGRLFKYMGGSPPDFESATVKATVKHSEYRGINETKLQRVKVA